MSSVWATVRKIPTCPAIWVFLPLSWPVTISSHSLCAPAKGHISMSVPVESDIAPLARLLIYAILPDGELIGDSAKYEVENCLPNKVGDLYFHKIFKIFLKKPWDLERHSLFSRWGDGGHGNRVTTARSYGNLIAFSAFFLSPILVHILAYCILLFLCVW